MVHPYGSNDTAIAWKKSYFILSDRLDFHKIDLFAKSELAELANDKMVKQFNYISRSITFTETMSIYA